MWYFAWILGVTLACTLGILNGMWLELHLQDEALEAERAAERGDQGRSPR